MTSWIRVRVGEGEGVGEGRLRDRRICPELGEDIGEDVGLMMGCSVGDNVGRLVGASVGVAVGLDGTEIGAVKRDKGVGWQLGGPGYANRSTNMNECSGMKLHFHVKVARVHDPKALATGETGFRLPFRHLGLLLRDYYLVSFSRLGRKLDGQLAKEPAINGCMGDLRPQSSLFNIHHPCCSSYVRENLV
jgi:hypothetical protein